MPMPEPPQDLSRLSLAEIARLAAERRLPPVARWNPDHCGTSDMRIARDGTWYHQGELAELALAEAAEPPGLWSGGAFFPLAAP